MYTRLLLVSALLLFDTASAFAQKGPTWRWASQPDLYPKVDLRAKVRRHNVYALGEVRVGKNRAAGKDSHALLTRELVRGKHGMVVWRTVIKEKQWTSLAGAALLVSGGLVFVARYNRISTTCRLFAFSAKDGRRLWAVTLRGVGPVSHSRWYNRVQLSIYKGNPVVFGNEGPTMGYVEVRKASTGALISNSRLKVSVPRHALAEPLYRELSNTLRRKPTYRVIISNFAKRHNMRFASAAARTKAFRKAAKQLDGITIAYGGGRRVIRVRLVGHRVHARRR